MMNVSVACLDGNSENNDVTINKEDGILKSGNKERNDKKIRILVGSPIHQKSEILNEFLISLNELDKKGLEVDYCFIDDNSDEKSSELLRKFKKENQVTIFKGKVIENNKYCNKEYTHYWDAELISKVANFKNSIIEFFIENEYDYLFFIDSDIVLHEKTLKQLLKCDKDIISNIFWTKWSPDSIELPQVWVKDSYTLYNARENELITEAEKRQMIQSFLNMLKKPGVYRVGGLGACTLIKRKPLLNGINFSPVYNLSYWGEDRHFCIRAAAYGYELYVDTHYPAYHIYRDTDLLGVLSYKEKNKSRDLEIVGSKIVDLIVEAVEKLETTSYEVDLNTDWMEYFTAEEGLKQSLRIKEDRENIINNKIINRTRVLECRLSFQGNLEKVIVGIKIENEGYKNDYSFYKEYEGIIVLIKEDSNWFISEYSIDKELESDKKPIIRKAKNKNNKLTLSMVVKNEANRYLRRVLESAKEYIDAAVIIDDGSCDNTVEICREILGDKDLKIIENEESKFSNEIELRKQQWDETINTNPDWILFLDADEIFEDDFKNHVENLLNDRNCDGYLFRLYDMWSEDYYRNDNLWYAHKTYRPFMIRYQKNFNYIWNETAQHCGRMPANVLNLPYNKCLLRLKHYGWAKEDDRISKYNRYMELDSDGKYGIMDQYRSILDKNPKLSKWVE